MNSANNITNYIKLNSAKPVIRHGESVKYINYSNENEQINLIKTVLNRYRAVSYTHLAPTLQKKLEAI